MVNCLGLSIFYTKYAVAAPWAPLMSNRPHMLGALLMPDLLLDALRSFLHLEQAHHCLTAAAHLLQPDAKTPFVVKAARPDAYA